MSADNRICILEIEPDRWAVWHGSGSCLYYEAPADAQIVNSEAEANALAGRLADGVDILEYGIQRITAEEQEEALALAIDALGHRLMLLRATGRQFNPEQGT